MKERELTLTAASFSWKRINLDAATRATASDEPVFITQRGRAAAVVVSAQRYERTQQELDILKALARGEAEIEAGAGHDLADVSGKEYAVCTDPGDQSYPAVSGR